MSVFVPRRGGVPTAKTIVFSLYNEAYSQVAGTWEVEAGTTWEEFVENGHESGNSTWKPRFIISNGLVRVKWGASGTFTASLWKTKGNTSTTVQSTEIIEGTTYYNSMA